MQVGQLHIDGRGEIRTDVMQMFFHLLKPIPGVPLEPQDDGWVEPFLAYLNYLLSREPDLMSVLFGELFPVTERDLPLFANKDGKVSVLSVLNSFLSLTHSHKRIAVSRETVNGVPCVQGYHLCVLSNATQEKQVAMLLEGGGHEGRKGTQTE